MLPSEAQWKTMGATSSTYTTLLDGFDSVGGTNLKSGPYWSSTDIENDNAFLFDFASGHVGWYWLSKDDPLPLVRACLAF